jgi:LEA14-like dessication related protein
MKRLSIKTLIILLSSLFLVLMVLLYFSFETPAFVGLSSYRVVKVDNEKIVVDCKINLQNNNPYSIRCKQLKVSLSHQNIHWIEGSLVSPITIKAKGVTTLPIRCTITNNESSLLIENVINKDDLVVEKEIKGQFTFLGLPYKNKAPIVLHPKSLFNEQVETFIKNLDLSIQNLKINKISTSETSIGGLVCIKNIFPFPLVLKENNFWISNDSSSIDTLSVWRSNQEQELPSQQTVCLPLEWEIKNMSVGKWALSQLTQGYMITYLHGFVGLSFQGNEFRFPIEKCIKIHPFLQKIELVKK